MVGSTQNSVSYEGNDSDSIPYAIPFRYDDESWIVVTVEDADGYVETLEQGTDYTLSGNGSASTGEMTTAQAYEDTFTLTIWREAPGLQSVDLTPNAPLPAVTVEGQLDRVAMAAEDSPKPSAFWILKRIVDRITGIIDALNPLSWNSITDKPATFAPSAHTHPTSELSDATADGQSNPGKALKTDGSGLITVSALTLGAGSAAASPFSGMLLLRHEDDLAFGTVLVPSANTQSGEGAAPYILVAPKGSGFVALTPNEDGSLPSQSLIVSGTVSPDMNGELFPVGQIDGRTAWSSNNQPFSYPLVSAADGIYLFSENNAQYTLVKVVSETVEGTWISSSFPSRPDSVAAWTPDGSETGTPSITLA